MDDLVKRLSHKQQVEFESRTDSLEEIKERLLNTKFVFVTFSETNGGTELGISIDTESTDVNNADFTQGSGVISVVGTCELNYQKVRCMAEIDLSTKNGVGYLQSLN